MRYDSAERQCEPCVVALGNFDGVHIGHRALIEQGLRHACLKGRAFKVLLFAPHPQSVLCPERRLFFLADLVEKERILVGLGVNQVLVYPFTREFAEMPPEEFVLQTLAPLAPVHVVVGYNYTFGRRACGKTADLEALGRKWGFAVDIVPEQRIDDMRVSSSDIRHELRQGFVEKAALMLGRPYRLKGCVERGFQRGRKMGFPTANLLVPSDCVVPGPGVYAGNVLWQGNSLGAVINIGVCPTFSDTESGMRVEVHILGFQGELYGQVLCVDFLVRLRSERRFESAEKLAEQIHRDIVSAGAVLSGHGRQQ